MRRPATTALYRLFITITVIAAFPIAAQAEITVPIPLTPANWETSVDLRPYFTWHTVDVKNPNCTMRVCRDQSATDCVDGTQGYHAVVNGISAYHPLNELQPNTQYYWRVRCIINDSFGQWSDIQTFYTTAAVQPDMSAVLGLVKGWNLVGATVAYPATLFMGQTDIESVWKWQSNSWAVLIPGVDDGGAAYAKAHGFNLLSNIKFGEGFWINYSGAE